MLQKAYTIYEQTGQVYPNRAKVQHMVDKMSVGNSLVLSHAKEHVIDNMPNDWVQAVNYMKTKVAQAFPGAQAPRFTCRFVNEVNSNRGRGCGCSGHRGGGRDGRGRGRAGRGGRGGRGTPCPDDDSPIPKSINGVNTANIFRNFDDWEWATLGQDWKRRIIACREAAQHRDKSRKVSEAGT